METGGPGGGGTGVGRGWRLERGELNGEVAEGGTLSAGTDDLKPCCFRSEAVEELVLAATSHDVEALEVLAGDGSYVAKYFCVTRSETVKEERRKLGRVVWRWVELGQASATKLRVDAVGHVAREKKIGVVDVEGIAVSSDGGGFLDEMGDGERFSIGGRRRVVPSFETLAKEPHAINILVEAEGFVDTTKIGEVFRTR